MRTVLDEQRPTRRRPPFRPAGAGIGLRWIFLGALAAAAVSLAAVAVGRLASWLWASRPAAAVGGPAYAVAAFVYGEDGSLEGAALVEVRADEASVRVTIVPTDLVVAHAGDRLPIAEVFGRAGAHAAAGALAPRLGRPPDGFVSAGPEALGRFVDSLGGIPLPIRDDVVYEAEGRRIVVPAGVPRYDGQKVEEYLAAPREKGQALAPARAVAMGCVRRLADLEAADVPVAEIWAALAEGWEGNVPPEALAWAAGVARAIGPTSLSIERAGGES